VRFFITCSAPELPETFGDLRFVPAAVLSALSAGGAAARRHTDLSLGNTRLIAGLLAVLVAWWTKNTLITILVGMALLVALQFTI
jgi:branched-subunit amino acid transport protein